MKLKKIVLGVAAAGMFSVLAVPAQATVLDAWQMVINGNTYSNIGRLSLTGGSSIVQQQVDSSGNPFVGASFTENGAIYTISFIGNSVVGPADAGNPISLATADQLKFDFTNVQGHVTTLNSNGSFNFVFDSGSFAASLIYGGTPQALGLVTGIGGSLFNTTGFSGANGQSVTDVMLTSLLNGFQLNDSTGAALDLNKILFEAVTNNQVVGTVSTGACTFDATANCSTFNVNSNGDGYLTTVPEPASLALLGIGLMGMGFASRSRAKK